MDDARYHEQARKCCQMLREMGFTYEEIPDHLASPERPRLETWQVYAYANPDKSASQVAEWRRKHCSDGGSGMRRATFPVSITTP
jgi:hypothetical protein